MPRKIHSLPIIVLSVLGLIATSGCDSAKLGLSSRRPKTHLSIGTTALNLSSLIWVAKGRGYFEDEGLDISIQLYESGHLALKDLVTGGLDLATASEFVAVRRNLEENDFRILSILAEAQDQELVARRDRGIAQASDLKNKRIGLALHTSAKYYLDLMLLLEKIQPNDVSFVDLLPSRQIAALERGDVDAIMTWDPFATMAKRQLGANAVSWPGQSGQDEYWLLLASNETIEKRPEAVRSFLRALNAAEAFIGESRDRAIRIVSGQLQDQHLPTSWKNHKFLLGLHRPLVLKMEAELIWLSSAPGADRIPKLDLYKMMYFDALRSVAKDKIAILQ